MAKRYFYVFAAVLLLVAAYGVGAKRAGAQGAAIVDAATIGDLITGSATAAIDHQVYFIAGTGQQVMVVGPPVPGNSRIVGCQSNGGDAIAVLENGEIWKLGPGFEWHLTGMFPAGGATSSSRTSLGEIKAQYR
jgi:hypothetical protein